MADRTTSRSIVESARRLGTSVLDIAETRLVLFSTDLKEAETIASFGGSFGAWFVRDRAPSLRFRLWIRWRHLHWWTTRTCAWLARKCVPNLNGFGIVSLNKQARRLFVHRYAQLA